ncbi:MAG: hypothetical protein OXG88_07275, partial [Gammaproteobacteria bacterium]|nr:hypothetical protein [Gammaproteobacteria bacterium]
MSNECNLLKRVISKWYEFVKTVTFSIGLFLPLVVSQIILAQATEDCSVILHFSTYSTISSENWLL